MTSKYNLRDRLLICLAAAGVTCFVMLLLMIFYGLAPFGNCSLAAADCKIQYLDFFNYYKDVLTAIRSLKDWAATAWVCSATTSRRR